MAFFTNFKNFCGYVSQGKFGKILFWCGLKAQSKLWPMPHNNFVKVEAAVAQRDRLRTLVLSLRNFCSQSDGRTRRISCTKCASLSREK